MSSRPKTIIISILLNFEGRHILSQIIGIQLNKQTTYSSILQWELRSYQWLIWTDLNIVMKFNSRYVKHQDKQFCNFFYMFYFYLVQWILSNQSVMYDNNVNLLYFSFKLEILWWICMWCVTVKKSKWLVLMLSRWWKVSPHRILKYQSIQLIFSAPKLK